MKRFKAGDKVWVATIRNYELKVQEMTVRSCGEQQVAFTKMCEPLGYGSTTSPKNVHATKLEALQAALPLAKELAEDAEERLKEAVAIQKQVEELVGLEQSALGARS